MPDPKAIILGLDLATSLATRLLAVVQAFSTARAAGRDDLTEDELDDFAAADDDASLRLVTKIAAKRAERARG